MDKATLALAVAAMVGLTVTRPVLGHPEAPPATMAHPDGEVTVQCTGGSGGRTYALRTLAEQKEVAIELDATLDAGRIAVVITDAKGRTRAELEGGALGHLRVGTGSLVLVPAPAGEGEAPRGDWRVVVHTDGMRGSYVLRYRGFSPLEREPGPGADAGHS